MVRGRVHEHLRCIFGPWAGEELVCVGENTEVNDFPPAIVADKQLYQVIRRWRYLERDPGTNTVLNSWPVSLYDYSKHTISRVMKVPCVMGEICRLRRLLFSREWCTSARFNSLGLHFRGRREFFSTDEPWILRNLTSKQLVRAEAIALKPEFIHGPDIDVLGFGEVLITRICWSSAPAVGFADPTNICRGAWAGHRFDITTLAKHRRETGHENDWVDVSDEVAEEMATIWQRNYGADWREFLCQFG